jgi:hypothetical protein
MSSGTTEGLSGIWGSSASDVFLGGGNGMILRYGGGIDSGDAPDPAYPTLLARNGARHTIVSGMYLGASVDGENDGQPNAFATGDDDSITNDEDGVVFGGLLRPCGQAPVTITASKAGYIDAWIDFNRDGDWADAGEQIFKNKAVTAGANNLNFTVSCNAMEGRTFARFRYSSTGYLSYVDSAPDGEVEDYAVMIGSQSTTAALKLDLLTDDDGSETSWEIRNAGGEIVASGSGYANNKRYIETIYLGLGEYTFTIFDSVGDGICCNNGDGHYTLTDLTTSKVIAVGGEFADSESTAFSLEKPKAAIVPMLNLLLGD